MATKNVISNRIKNLRVQQEFILKSIKDNNDPSTYSVLSEGKKLHEIEIRINELNTLSILLSEDNGGEQ